jgi:hypothetical protein
MSSISSSPKPCERRVKETNSRQGRVRNIRFGSFIPMWMLGGRLLAPFISGRV